MPKWPLLDCCGNWFTTVWPMKKHFFFSYSCILPMKNATNSTKHIHSEYLIVANFRGCCYNFIITILFLNPDITMFSEKRGSPESKKYMQDVLFDRVRRCSIDNVTNARKRSRDPELDLLQQNIQLWESILFYDINLSAGNRRTRHLVNWRS